MTQGNLERVMQAAAERCGLRKIIAVEQLGERLYLVRLTGGRVMTAVPHRDGSVDMEEVED